METYLNLYRLSNFGVRHLLTRCLKRIGRLTPRYSQLFWETKPERITIGRELYTAPFIWISGASKYDKFWVKDMEVSPDKKITSLTICTCDAYGNHKDDVAFQFPKGGKKAEKKAEKKDPEESPRGLRPIIDMNDPEATEAEMAKPIDAAAWRGLQRELKEAGLDPQKVLDFYEIKKPSAITWDMLGRIRSEKKFISTLDELKTEVA